MSGRPRLVEEGTPIYQGEDLNADASSEKGGTCGLGHAFAPATATTEKPRHEHKKISTHIVIGEQPRRGNQVSSGTETHDVKELESKLPVGGSSLAQAAFGSGYTGASSATSSHPEPRKFHPRTARTHLVIEGNAHDMDTSEEPGHRCSHQESYQGNRIHSNDHVRQHPSSVPITVGLQHHHTANRDHRHHTGHNHAHHHTTAPITIGSQLEQPNPYHMQPYTPVEAEIQQQPHTHYQHHTRHHFSHEHTKQHESTPITIGNHSSHYFYHGDGTSQAALQGVMPQNSAQAEARMELDDIIPKEPLIVIDGANVAYDYADTNLGLASTTLSVADRNNGRRKIEPDARGINVAAHYFLSAGCRVQVVIPTGWLRAKPRPGDENRGDALMETPQVETLRELKERNLLCTAPPADDDDAYAIAIARREDSRARRRGGEGGGFVLSNDFFRDAIARDNDNGAGTGLRNWLESGSGQGPGRISYSFLNMDSANAFGDHELDFMPNPRHRLIERIEYEHRSNELPPS